MYIYKQDRLARLLQRTPPATLGDFDDGSSSSVPSSSASSSDDDEAPSDIAGAKEEDGEEAGGVTGGNKSSLAAAILPLVRRHGLTRAELVLRVRYDGGICCLYCVYLLCLDRGIDVV